MCVCVSYVCERFLPKSCIRRTHHTHTRTRIGFYYIKHRQFLCIALGWFFVYTLCIVVHPIFRRPSFVCYDLPGRSVVSTSGTCGRDRIACCSSVETVRAVSRSRRRRLNCHLLPVVGPQRENSEEKIHAYVRHFEYTLDEKRNTTIIFLNTRADTVFVETHGVLFSPSGTHDPRRG